MPELQQVADEHPGQVALVTVMMHGTADKARKAADKAHLTSTILVGDDDYMETLGADSYPWTIVIGKDGKAVTALRGPRDLDEFRAVIKPLL